MSLSSSCASQVDGPTRRALVAFSYHLTIGNMDEAHRAVKLVKSAQAWHASPSVAALPRPTARLAALSTRTRVRDAGQSAGPRDGEGHELPEGCGLLLEALDWWTFQPSDPTGPLEFST